MNFELIDDIIEQFREDHNLVYLSKIVEGKIHITHKIGDRKYKGIVCNHRYYRVYPNVNNQLQIKLSHGEFCYKNLTGEYVTDIVSGGWYIVNDKCLRNMKEIRKIQEEFDCVFKMLYHWKNKKIIFEFYRGNVSVPFMTFTFEERDLADTNKKQYYVDLRT